MSEPVTVQIRVLDKTNATIEIKLPEELVSEFMSDVANLCECYCDDDDDDDNDNEHCCCDCCNCDEQDTVKETGSEANLCEEEKAVVEEVKE